MYAYIYNDDKEEAAAAANDKKANKPNDESTLRTMAFEAGRSQFPIIRC